mgnify:CR=1 FL=1
MKRTVQAWAIELPDGTLRMEDQTILMLIECYTDKCMADKVCFHEDGQRVVSVTITVRE